MLKIEKYKTFQSSHCFLGCFQDYFRYMGISIEEDELFFMAKGFNTKYKKQFCNGKVKIDVFSDIIDTAFRFCDLADIPYQYFKDIGPGKFDETLIKYLSNNVPVIVKVISSYLDYSYVLKESMDVVRFITISGFDNENGMAHVNDSFIPLVPPVIFEGWVSYDMIKQAMEAAGNDFIVFNCDLAKEAHNEKCFREYKKNLATNVKAGITEYLKGGKHGETSLGIDAMKAFVDDMPKLLDMFQDKFSGEMQRLSNILKTHGVITSRYLLYKTLNRIVKDKNNEFCKLCERVYGIYKNWNMISLFMVKVGFSNKKNNLDILAREINNLHNEEITVFKELINHI